MSLKPYRDDVHAVHPPHGERRSSPSLADVGIAAGPIEGLTGVWTHEPRKIASIGVHVSRGVTTHGFAINVNNDLQPFEWIVPCGIDNCRMTSVARELHAQFDMDRFMDIVEPRVRRRLRAAAGAPRTSVILAERGGRVTERAARDALAGEPGRRARRRMPTWCRSARASRRG